MLKQHFVPVAIDQWYQRKQNDDEGRFFQRIAKQGPRKNLDLTTQGFYVATPAGQLIGYNNNRTPKRVHELLSKAISRKFNMVSKPILEREIDSRLRHQRPGDTVVARVNSKVLGGYRDTNDPWRRIQQRALGRDNLWVTGNEQQALAAHHFPDTLARKIARFHLTDNTRGEPPMWGRTEIKKLEIQIDDQRNITGQVHLQTSDGRRGYQAALRGRIEFHDDRLTRFDLVAKGQFWGQGRYTQGAPPNKFPFAVAIRIADFSDVADDVLPQALKAAGVESYRKP